MTPEVGFVASLVGTVLLLVCVAWTGLRARRRLHLCLVASGVAPLRSPRWRRLHRSAAFLVLGLTLAAAGTGAWMMLLAEPLPAVPSST